MAASSGETPIRGDTQAFEQLKALMGETEKKITAAISETAVKLELSNLKLISVPGSLQFASALRKLDLSNNNLECLPECVTFLVNLESLDVGSNHLKSLPDSIGQLVELTILNVSSNMLVIIPESIQYCGALEELSANLNHLERLPESIGFRLKNLRKLLIHSNKITYLPSSISYMKSLRVLDVHLNKLSNLPEDIGHLMNLEVLNASKNFHHLVALPESIGRLACLMELDLSYNQISILPDSMGALEKLQVLGLEGNPLILPPPEIVEHSVEAVKRYMGKRLIKKGHMKRNSTGQWCGWFRSCTGNVSAVSGRLSWDEYRTVEVDTSSTPRRSPSRIFSPRRSQRRRCLSTSHAAMY